MQTHHPISGGLKKFQFPKPKTMNFKRTILERLKRSENFITDINSNDSNVVVVSKTTDFSIRKILSESLPSTKKPTAPSVIFFKKPSDIENSTDYTQIIYQPTSSSFNRIVREDNNNNNNNQNVNCDLCGKVFESSIYLGAHLRAEHPARNVLRYECTWCGKGFSQLRNYKYHVSVHRGTKEFAAECPECGKMFNDKGYLSSHLKIHRNRKEYGCPHCPKSFNQRVAFNMHIRIHTGVKPHGCEECGKRFSRKMLLKQHLRTHSGEKPYQCSVCGKQFADRSNMTLHHRLHSGGWYLCLL